MTDAERDALIGRAVQERQRLKQGVGCLARKADQMQQAIAEGLRLLTGETAVHMKDGALYFAASPHSMMVRGCDWPSASEIGELAIERLETKRRLTEVESQLRNIGI